MRTVRSKRQLRFRGMNPLFRVFLVAAVLLLAACGAPAAQPKECLVPSTVPPDAPLTRFGVHFTAGTQVLQFDSEASFSNGVRFRPNKVRAFLSELKLINDRGETVAADLVDERGQRLPYGLTMLDLERPTSLGFQLRAPAGSYRALALTLGVPQTCESGATLNHVDASTMPPPLDVDSDMYWSWNPGYVFLKFEGQLTAPGETQPGFFFHVGGDERLVKLELSTALTIEPTGGSGPELLIDVERLLTSPSGAARPDVRVVEQRRVHGGEWADALAENLRGSGVVRLAVGH